MCQKAKSIILVVEKNPQMLLKVRQIMAILGGRKNNIKKTTRQCMKRFADPFWALFAILGHMYQKEEWFPDT